MHVLVSYLFTVFRMLLQQHLEGLQTMYKTLRVIESIDPKDDLLIGKHDLVGRFGERDESIEGYADRERTYAYGSTAVLDQQIFTIDPTAEAPLTTVDEIQTVVLDMETDHVATEHTLEYLVGPWEKSKYVPWWEWNVKEEAQLQLQILLVGGLSDPIGRRHQVIIVYPNERSAVVPIRLFLVDLFQSADLTNATKGKDETR